jgi:hypothetical protein
MGIVMGIVRAGSVVFVFVIRRSNRRPIDGVMA